MEKKHILLFMLPLLATPVVAVGIIIAMAFSRSGGGGAVALFVIVPVLAIGVFFAVAAVLVTVLAKSHKTPDGKPMRVEVNFAGDAKQIAKSLGVEVPGRTGDIADDAATQRMLAELDAAPTRTTAVGDRRPEAARRLAWSFVAVTVVLMAGGLATGRASWEALVLGPVAIGIALIWCALEGGFKSSRG